MSNRLIVIEEIMEIETRTTEWYRHVFDLLNQGFTLREVGEDLGVSYALIRLRLTDIGYRSADFPRKRRIHVVRCHACNKEEEVKGRSLKLFCSSQCYGNYIRFTDSDHSRPNRYKTTTVRIKGGGSRTQFKHRVIMEQHLGRKLRTDEHVTFKNGDQHDLRIENLELIDATKHSSDVAKKLFGVTKGLKPRYRTIYKLDKEPVPYYE